MHESVCVRKTTVTREKRGGFLGKDLLLLDGTFVKVLENFMWVMQTVENVEKYPNTFIRAYLQNIVTHMLGIPDKTKPVSVEAIKIHHSASSIFQFVVIL